MELPVLTSGRLWNQCQVPHSVIVDCSSSSEVAAQHAAWLEKGIHVVTANKKVNK
jgi:homoserine dehydrogenase